MTTGRINQVTTIASGKREVWMNGGDDDDDDDDDARWMYIDVYTHSHTHTHTPILPLLSFPSGRPQRVRTAQEESFRFHFVPSLWLSK